MPVVNARLKYGLIAAGVLVVAAGGVMALATADASAQSLGWTPTVRPAVAEQAWPTRLSPVRRSDTRTKGQRSPLQPRNLVAPEEARGPDRPQPTDPRLAPSLAAGTNDMTTAAVRSEPSDKSLAEQYCLNIADAAADARVAWQARAIGDLEKQLDHRIKLLEERAAELKQWLARREEFAEKATQKLVAVFAGMRPDAVAQQFANLDEGTAAALLGKIESRKAGAILNEMDPVKAARLTATLAGVARIPPDKKS